MDNENKEIDLETDLENEFETEFETDLETQNLESSVEEAEESVEEPVEEAEESIEEPVEEAEFDPTESDDFYNNLEVAIGSEDESGNEDIPELSLPEDTFVLVGEEKPEAEKIVEDDMFAGVDAALSEQIEQEFGKETEVDTIGEYEEVKPVGFWKLIPTWAKVLAGVILVVLLAVGLLFGTKGGRKILYNLALEWLFKDVKEDDGSTPTPELTISGSPFPTENPELTLGPTSGPTTNPEQNPSGAPEPTKSPDLTGVATPTPTPGIVIMDDENIINVLLLGEENIYKSGRGRTDAIIVVSINLKGGPLKMVSFQRDIYINDIKDDYDDRINAAYRYGGFPLAVETIEKNFGIDIDAYAKVDFKGFENLIDSLGGLRISLTAKESDYLNTTTYISKASERNTVAGYQNMTGAQVLGYCRVRNVPTAQGLVYDRGRNYRHRVVLQALFNKFKEKNPTQLISLMEDCLSYVTVSSNLKDLAKKCVFEVVENKMFEIDTMQVPQAGTYKDVTINGSKVIEYFPECVDKLQEFIYGDN